MKKLFPCLSVAVVNLFFIVTLAYAQSILSPGVTLEGFALDKKNKNFPVTVKIESIEETTGNFSGEITWPSLNSIHRIEGRIHEHTVTFKEVSHIKKGGAHLYCEYAMVIDGKSMEGRWVEPERDRGTIQLQIK